MDTPNQIRLRKGVRIEKGEAVYNDAEHEYCEHYLVDHENKATVCSITLADVWTIMHPKHVSAAIRGTLTEALKTNYLLAGQIAPKKPVGSPDQKMLFQAIPLPFKPDSLLERYQIIGRIIFNKITMMVLAVLAALLMPLLARQMTAFIEYTSNVFSVNYLMEHGVEFAAAFVIIRICHELAHALACKRAGGYVEGFTIIFIAGAPLPSTRMNMLHKAGMRDRIMVAMAGIYIELWIAVIAAYLWVISPGSDYRPVYHYLAIVNPALTLSANLLPVMKFDGYHAIASILRMPKLYEMATEAIKPYLHRAIGFDSPSLNYGTKIDPLLPIYGGAIFVWRTLVLPGGLIAGILLWFNDDRVAYILIMAVVVMFYIKPLIKGVSMMRKLTYRPNMATFTGYCALAAVLGWLAVPLPHVNTVQGAILFDTISVTAPIDGAVTYIKKQGRAAANERVATFETINGDNAMIKLETQRSALTYNTEQGAYAVRAKEMTLSTQESNITENEKVDIVINQAGDWRPETTQSYYSKAQVIGHLAIKNSAKAEFYIPKEITTNDSLVVVYSGAGNETKTINLRKLSEFVVTQSLPAFVLDENQGPLSSNIKIQPVQKYVGTPLDDIEKPITGYIKTTYSMAWRFGGKLVNAFQLL